MKDATPDNPLFHLLESVVDSLPLALFCKDYAHSQGQFVLWNRGAEETWGFARKDVVGKSDYDLFNEEMAKHFYKKDKETLDSMKLVFIEQEPVESKSGKTILVRTWKVPVNDLDGKPRYLLGISQDITRLVRIEKELEEQRQTAMVSAKLATLGEMASGIAHEINNPMAIISGLSSVLLKKIDSGSYDLQECKDSIQKMKDTSTRVSKIVNGLKTYSQDSEQLILKNESSRNLLEETLSFCKAKIENEGIQLQIDEFEDQTINVMGVQISQVFLNLLNNARDIAVASQDKWIKISSETTADSYIVSITDPGKGIEKEVVDKMFNPFYSTKVPGKGTGLGLGISKKIIESHGGKLTYTLKNGFTTFEIVLPLSR